MQFGVGAVAGALCLLGSLSVATTAHGQSAAVLGLQSLEGDDGFAADLTVALRYEAARTLGWTVIEEDISLAQILLLEGCGAPDVECLKRAAQTLETDLLVFGTLQRSDPGRDDRFEVSLSLFDASAGAIKATVDQDFSRTDQTGALRAAASEQLVALDQGESDAAADDESLAPDARLESLEDSPAADRGVPNWLVWTVMGAAAVTLGVQLVAWVRANRAGDTLISLPDAEPVRRLQQTMPDQTAHACNFTDVPTDVQEICDDANTWSTVTYITLPLTILLGLAGTTLLVLDATDALADDSSFGDTSRERDSVELSLAPWVGPPSRGFLGGAQAALRF